MLPCGDSNYLQTSLEPCLTLQQSQMMTSSLTNLPPNNLEDEYDTSVSEMSGNNGGSRPYADKPNGPDSLPTPQVAEKKSVSTGIPYLSR